MLIIFACENLHRVERFESQECDKFHFVILGLADEYFRALVAGNCALGDFEQNLFAQKLFVFLGILVGRPAMPNSRDHILHSHDLVAAVDVDHLTCDPGRAVAREKNAGRAELGRSQLRFNGARS